METDKKKAKVQLLRELEEVRRRNRDLEASEAKHKKTMASQQVVSSISSRFIRGSNLDEAINISLADMGILSSASRTYLFLFHDDGASMSNSHEWCAEGVSPEIDSLQNLTADTVPWWMERLRNREVIQIDDVSKLPNEAKAEKEILKRQDIKSVLVLPVYVDGELSGFIGFDNVVQTGKWSDEDLALLRIASEIIGRALDRQWAEDALIENEEKFRMISASAEDAILMMDNDGRISFWNKAAERIFGWSEEEALGKDLHLFLVPKRYHDDYRKGFEKFRRTGEGIAVGKTLELSALRKDGTELPVELSVAAAKLRGQWNAIGILRDITERRRAEEERRRLEEQMLQSQKVESIGILAGGLAHQFNNLLMALLGNVELIVMDMHPEAPMRESVAEIEKVSKRMVKLVKELLAYAGRGKLIVETIDLTLLFREMLQLLHVSISKKIKLEYTLDEDLPNIEADASQLRQVVMNLITNASEAIGQEDGVISVHTGAKGFGSEDLDGIYGYYNLLPGRYIFFEVSDTGCGIDTATLPKIFNPFFSTKFTGRGLGLAAVLGIVKGLHGAIKVRSKPGSGSTFTVLFPSSDQIIKERDRESLEAWSASERKTILVVDDEEPIRKVVKKMLEQAGYSVQTAINGREAVDLFRNHSDEIDCVLLDLTMPLLNGRETLAEFRQVREDVHVILSSGYNEQEAIKNFDEKAHLNFIQKPYNAADLLTKLKQVLKN